MTAPMANFAVIGVGGFVAPRHLKAIRDTGNRLVAATDPNDSVGLLDQYSFDVRYFREIERFDRHLDKLRRGPEAGRVHWVSVCSPNFLHDAHIRLALRNGADVICEKPLVINPWNLDALQELESETGRRIATILQLRVHPALVALKAKLDAEPAGRRRDVVLTYVTSRGPWYHVSWKGLEERSGGVATNIGIHFFDLLMWLFGSPTRTRCTCGNRPGPRAPSGWLTRTSGGSSRSIPRTCPRARGPPGGRRFAPSRWTVTRSSSPKGLVTFTRGSMRRPSPDAASGLRTRDRRLRSSTRCARRPSGATASATRLSAPQGTPHERGNAHRCQHCRSASPVREGGGALARTPGGRHARSAGAHRPALRLRDVRGVLRGPQHPGARCQSPDWLHVPRRADGEDAGGD